MKPKLSSLFLSAVITAIAVFSAVAQTPRPEFNRPQTFDVQHYTIRASFDREKKLVFGDTTVSLKPLSPDFRQISLDAVDLKFESVKLDPPGIDLPYKSAGDKIIVTLDKSYSQTETIAVRFKYKATPNKGVYFVDADSGHSAQIWTQGEPNEARHWFPSFDFPSDKATTEQYLTVEKGQTVIGNGELVDKSENSDGTETWHYKMPVPHSTYLVSFVIGKYAKIEDRYKEVPLGFYVYPGREATGRKAFGKTKEMMRIFEDETGIAFPFNKYDQTVVASFQFGGMENITATTMADTEIFFADFDFGEATVTDLVSHELAHSWFGNLVTCRNWAELWLNEGFATYMEAVYRERAYDRGSYLRKIRADAANFLVDDTINKKRHALFNQRAVDVTSLFDNASTTYHKGGVVLHMLREQVGSGPFWKAVNTYLNRHKYGSVESTDLRKAMEEASGQNLEWFFDQWVYKAGAPRLDVRQKYNVRSGTLTVTVAQTHSTDAITPTVFRLPMDVAFKIGSREIEEKIEITKRVQTFSFKTTGQPTGLRLDSDEKIPLKRVKIHQMTTVR